MTCSWIARRLRWMLLPALLGMIGVWAVPAAAQPATLHDRLTTAAETAGFAEADRSTLTALADEHLQPGTPGAAWAFVDAASKAFSTDQIRALSSALMEEAPARMRGERGRRGMRGERGMQGERGMRGQKEDRPGRGMRDRRGGPDAEDGFGRNSLMAELDLTDAQKTEMRSIRKGYREKMQALHPERGECPDEATMEEVRALQTQMRADMTAQLTTEQTEQLNALRSERMATRQARRAERQAARNDALGLSAEQIEQVNAMHAEWMAERDMMPGMGPHMRRMMMRCRPDEASAHAAMHNRVKEILNEDQQALADLHRALRMNARPMMMGPRGMDGRNGR